MLTNQDFFSILIAVFLGIISAFAVIVLFADFWLPIFIDRVGEVVNAYIEANF